MRYFYVRTGSGKSSSLFNIYYNTVRTATIATVIEQTPISRSYPAINLTYRQLTTSNGVLVQVPDNTSTIIVTDVTSICSPLSKTLEVYATITKTDVTITNGKNGTITVSTPAGGTPPYQVKINDFPYQTLSTSVTYTGLSGGDYLVYVRDSLGEETITTIEIYEPEPADCTIIVVTEPSPNLSNGTILLNSNGGSWPKTYKLYRDTSFPYSDACGDQLIVTYTGVTEQNQSITVNNLPCGYYCLEVTDATTSVINTGTVNICPRQPQNITYPVSVRVGSTINTACAGSGGSQIIYSLLPSADGLVSGYQYFDEFGSPIYGLSYNYWSHPENCNVGTIDAFGYFTLLQNCTNCL